MRYIKVPEVSILLDPPLTHVQYHILYKLCDLDFRYSAGRKGRPWFYIQDRDLASLCGCSTSQIYAAKNLLKKHGLIDFEVRSRNRTYYTILFNRLST